MLRYALLSQLLTILPMVSGSRQAVASRNEPGCVGTTKGLAATACFGKPHSLFKRFFKSASISSTSCSASCFFRAASCSKDCTFCLTTSASSTSFGGFALFLQIVVSHFSCCWPAMTACIPPTTVLAHLTDCYIVRCKTYRVLS